MTKEELTYYCDELDVTEEDIEAAHEKLIEACCEMNGAHSLREIAERILVYGLGTAQERLIYYSFLTDPEVDLDLHFGYVDEKEVN